MNDIEKTNIFDELDQLFIKWRQIYDEEDQSKFCEDGLMEKPDRSKEDESALWRASSRRVAFLLKDYHHEGRTDVRTWLVDSKNGEANLNFKPISGTKNIFKSLALLLYGLTTYSIENEYGEGMRQFKVEEFDSNKDVFKAHLLSTPFACIETKKLGGTTKCPYHVLKKAIYKSSGNNKYGENFLQEEINILKPNIIVCLSPDIFKLMAKTLYENEFQEQPVFSEKYILDGKIHEDMTCKYRYYPNQKVVVIQGYHPSGWCLWKIIERVLYSFRAFIKKHPDF